MGKRLYYADSFLKEFTATVTASREFSREGQQPLWQIALDQSAFYPTSGGQPFDQGILRATSRDGAVLEVPVLAVEEDEAGEVWHLLETPLSTGTAVTGRIDWERRFDHIQQHSGQHLLSAVFSRELHAHTVSFHLGQELSTIDLDCAALAEGEIERIERIANELIAENRLVRIHTLTRAEAEALLAAGELRKLPTREGDLRVIEIADYDRNACGGTHVQATGQIGGLLLRSTERISRGVRVAYVCGLRAVRAARQDAQLLARAAAQLSLAPAALPEAVDRLRSEAKSGAKERQRISEELAGYHAVQLAVEVAIEDGIRWVDRQMDDRSPDYLRLLASSLTATVPRTVTLLTSSQGETVRLVFGRSQDLSFHCGLLLKETLAPLGLRAGGSPDLAQTEIPTAHLPEIRASLETSVRRDWAT